MSHLQGSTCISGTPTLQLGSTCLHYAAEAEALLIWSNPIWAISSIVKVKIKNISNFVTEENFWTWIKCVSFQKTFALPFLIDDKLLLYSHIYKIDLLLVNKKFLYRDPKYGPLQSPGPQAAACSALFINRHC